MKKRFNISAIFLPLAILLSNSCIGHQLAISNPNNNTAGCLSADNVCVSDTIVRTVKANNCNRSLKKLAALSKKDPIMNDLDMPKGKGHKKVEVVLFKLDHPISDDSLEKEYELRGLVPADPQLLAAVNKVDTAINTGTHWKNDNGYWCFVEFDQHYMFSGHHDWNWDSRFWFAGIRVKK